MDTGTADGDGDDTWRYPWPAGRRLAADLATLRDWTGVRVAELGCGPGHVGQAALAAGAGQVTFADINQAPLEHLASVLGANPRVRLERHAWGEPLAGGPYQVLLGGDILYRPAFFQRLATSLAGALAADGVAYLADPRTELDAEWFAALDERGLVWTTTRRPGPYTLVEARHRAYSRSATVS